MKRTIVYAVLGVLVLYSCDNTGQSGQNYQIKMPAKDTLAFKSGFEEVNGLNMYYEIYGQGKPLVLIHGGGSTIQSNFGNVIPLFAKNRKVIALELQAHGRSGDRDSDLSFQQDADDVAALLTKLNIENADIFGFSNGGTTTVELAVRHPELVDKIVLGSALCKRSGVPSGFWDFMHKATLDNMPQPLKEAYLSVAPNPENLQVMHDKDAKRMINFKDIPDYQLKAINAPTLIVNGDKDVITPEHAIELQRLIPNSRLAIIPGGHGEYIGEITTLKSGSDESPFVVDMIEQFLELSNDTIARN